jgi:hypothetical protein
MKRTTNRLAKLLSDDDVILLAKVRGVAEGKLPATALTVAQWERAEILCDFVGAFGA